MMKQLPKKKELMDSIVLVLMENGGHLSTAEINKLVAEQLEIPDDLLEIEDANCTGTEYSYRMRWARTELKQKELICNVRRGEWSLAERKL